MIEVLDTAYRLPFVFFFFFFFFFFLMIKLKGQIKHYDITMITVGIDKFIKGSTQMSF